MYYINMQLQGKIGPLTVNAENFPRLFENGKKVREISVLRVGKNWDVQTTLDGPQMRNEIQRIIEEEKRIAREMRDIERRRKNYQSLYEIAKRNRWNEDAAHYEQLLKLLDVSELIIKEFE